MPDPKANKRTPAQRSMDLAQIARWHRRGKTPQQMTDLLAAERPYRISRRQLANDLAKLDAQWLAEAATTIDSWKRKELAGLQDQENEAWEAWEKSKLDAIRKAATDESGGEGKGKQKRAVTTEGQCGDATYMRLILDIRDRRAKLLGLDAPSKTELSGTVGRVVFEIPDNGRDPDVGHNKSGV